MSADESLTDLDVPVTDELVVDLLEDSREVGGVLGYGYPQVPAARAAATG